MRPVVHLVMRPVRVSSSPLGTALGKLRSYVQTIQHQGQWHMQPPACAFGGSTSVLRARSRRRQRRSVHKARRSASPSS